MERSVRVPILPLSKGTFTATLNGYLSLDYVGDPTQELRLDQQVWTLISYGRPSTGGSLIVFTINVPSSLCDDGQPHTFSIGSQNTAISLYTQQLDFIAKTGEITVSLKDNRMRATFSFKAQAGAHEVEVSNGIFEVSNGTGSITAEFSGTEPPYPTFRATTVEINHLDLFPLPKDADAIKGRIHNYDPTLTQDDLLSIVVNKGTSPGTYKLGGDDPAVRVLFTQFAKRALLEARSGEVVLEHVPETGHGKGQFECEFADELNKFSAVGSFDVHHP